MIVFAKDSFIDLGVLVTTAPFVSAFARLSDSPESGINITLVDTGHLAQPQPQASSHDCLHPG